MSVLKLQLMEPVAVTAGVRVSSLTSSAMHCCKKADD
ncbi:class III lanthipeptide [Streptomyces sp. B93]|nr:class III lanthipeptide [Streptomyces sp. B93]MBQ1091342.1 class III lanthipeptide [Streptomyces sp. B93]